MTVLATFGWVRPAMVSAQALGTLQVEARVTAADFEWSSLLAARALADPALSFPDPDSPSRLAHPLSEVQMTLPGSRLDGEHRRALIEVQYLRN
jgi:hypothetical protein